MEIRPMLSQDWVRVAEIYAEGIATGHATFETSAPTWECWDSGHMATPRLVAVNDGQILGWAALSPVSSRCVYGGVAEVSVYVSSGARGQGIGSALLSELVKQSELEGIWTLQAGIFPENESSVRLHEHCGFRVVGRRDRLGRLAGVWRDVLLLERRSAVCGTEEEECGALGCKS